MTLTIARQEVEDRVLVALQGKLLRKDFFEEFCREFAKEMNRLRMEQRAAWREDSRQEASETLRRLIDAIVLIPEGGQPPSRDGDASRSGEPRRSSKSGGGLRIELKGNLAAMLTAAQPPSRAYYETIRAMAVHRSLGEGGKTKRPPEPVDLLEQVALVAGGGI